MEEVSVAITQALIAGAGLAADQRAELLSAVGLRLDALDDPDARIGVDVQMAVWNEMARITGDRNLGLRIAAVVPTHRFGLVAQTFVTSPTVGAALASSVRYSRLNNAAIAYQLEVSERSARFGFRMTSAPWLLPRHVAECLMGVVFRAVSQCSGPAVVPRAVRFQHTEPAEIDAHRRFFGAPVEFAKPQNELVLDRAVLDRPLDNADPDALVALEERAAKMLARLTPADRFVDDVRRVLFDLLGSGDVSVASVARALGTTRSVLERELAARGTSYRAILRSMRRDLARAYLEDKAWAIPDVAFVLGYSGTAAFKRAFLSWTGRSPAQYRLRFFDPTS